MKQDRYKEALALLERIIELEPNDPPAYVEKSELLYLLDRNEEALASVEYAIALDPTTQGAYRLKGWILSSPGHWEEAIAAYDLAIQMEPNNVECYQNKGFALIQLYRYEDALEMYEQALKIDPNARIALDEKGKMLEHLGRFDEMLAYYAQLAERRPDLAYAWYGQGRALEALGRSKEAVAVYDQVIQLMPNYLFAYLGRASALESLPRVNNVSGAVVVEEEEEVAMAWQTTMRRVLVFLVGEVESNRPEGGQIVEEQPGKANLRAALASGAPVPEGLPGRRPVAAISIAEPGAGRLQSLGGGASAGGPQKGSGKEETAERAGAQPVREEMALAAQEPPMTQEDWYWGRMTAGTEEDYLWRRLSDNWYMKDVQPAVYLEIHNDCYEAYNANPLAASIVEMITNFTLGRGLVVSATNRRVQRVLDAFWRDPDNHMDERIYTISTELSIYGEQFIRFFVNPIDGSVKIGQIDPSTIDEIETDPDNIEKPLRFHQRPVGPSATIPGDPSPTQRGVLDTEGRWFEAGREVAQFSIHKVSNAKRGRSDLATLLPWLRRYKDWLTDRVRLNKYKTAFLWDVKLMGADAKAIDLKRMQYAYPPEPGSVIIHNESEIWSAVKPEVNANDVESDGRAIKLMILAGAGLPEHYLADGGNANRATAAEMSLPTLLKFQRRQQVIEYILRTVLDRVILEAKRAGTLPAGVEAAYSITFPELKIGDNLALAQATATMVGALTTAKAQGWVSDETAMRLLFQFAGEEIDVHAEREKIKPQVGQ